MVAECQIDAVESIEKLQLLRQNFLSIPSEIEPDVFALFSLKYYFHMVIGCHLVKDSSQFGVIEDDGKIGGAVLLGRNGVL